MRRLKLGPTVALMLLSGCTLMPEYERPESTVPDEWPQGQAYAAEEKTPEAPAVSGVGWRELFADEPVLVSLVEQALAQNRELRGAVLDVERARAQYRIQGSELLPELDGNASYSREKVPAAASAAGVSFGPADRYRVGVGITSYELDLFGRVRSLEERALQSYLATREARRSAQIALVAEVANAYLTFVADRAQLALARETLSSREASLRLARQRFEMEVSSELDVNQARTAVEQARTALNRFRRRVAQGRNALRLLVGGELPQELAGERSLADISLTLAVPGELDSGLLLRRPDVARAERQLMAANADIGAARAAFFPTISLTGSYGSLSSDLDGLFQADSEAWSFTPRITLPIFDGGRRDAQLALAKVRKRQEVARYEGAIQQAFREVADALAARGTLDEQLAAQRALVEATERSYRLARKRYEQGIDSFLTVLDAQRELFAARQSLIEVRNAVLANRVALYRTLGGGWRSGAENDKPAQS